MMYVVVVVVVVVVVGRDVLLTTLRFDPSKSEFSRQHPLMVINYKSPRSPPPNQALTVLIFYFIGSMVKQLKFFIHVRISCYAE